MEVEGVDDLAALAEAYLDLTGFRLRVDDLPDIGRGDARRLAPTGR